jgi:hypothetical protein
MELSSVAARTGRSISVTFARLAQSQQSIGVDRRFTAAARQDEQGNIRPRRLICSAVTQAAQRFGRRALRP